MTGAMFHEPPICQTSGEPSQQIIGMKNRAVVRNSYRVIRKLCFNVIIHAVVCQPHIFYNLPSSEWIGFKRREECSDPSITGVYVWFVECIPIRYILTEFINSFFCKVNPQRNILFLFPSTKF